MPSGRLRAATRGKAPRSGSHSVGVHGDVGDVELGQAEAEHGTASRGMSGYDRTALFPGHLGHDGQPQP